MQTHQNQYPNETGNHQTVLRMKEERRKKKYLRAHQKEKFSQVLQREKIPHKENRMNRKRNLPKRKERDQYWQYQNSYSVVQPRKIIIQQRKECQTVLKGISKEYLITVQEKEKCAQKQIRKKSQAIHCQI